MVESISYSPERGDLVWLNFNPQSGHEQKGRRPAIVLSPEEYNHKVGLAILCPVTSSIKGYPFEVILPESCCIKGVILTDQVKSLDWSARSLKLIEKLPQSIISEVQRKLELLLL